MDLNFRLKLLRSLLSLFIIASYNSSRADNRKSPNDPGTETAEKIVITGSRNERVLSNAPVKTELVEKDVIERHHLTDLSQVLDNIPGITLQGLTARMGASAVVQGLGDDHVLVMIDGIPQIQTSASGYDLTQLSVNDIEKVEVIKGGASSLYGSQAIGGVINVITKKPKERLQYTLDLRNTYIPTEVVDRNEVLPNTINTTVSGELKKIARYKLSYGYRNQGSVDLDRSSYTQDSPALLRHNISGYLSKKVFEDSDLYFDYRFIDESLEAKVSRQEGTVKNPYARDSETQTQSMTLGLNTKVFNDSKLKLHAHYTRALDDLFFDNLNTPYLENVKSADLNTFMLESQLDTNLFSDNITTLGFLYRSQFLDQVDTNNTATGSAANREVGRKSINFFETYAQHSITKENFELTPGIRGQYDSDFGGNVSPSINTIYSPKIWNKYKTNFRSSIGTGYKVPTLKERFFMMDHRAIANYMIIGNDNLSPERSVSFQAGFELLKADDYSFHINGFVNNVTDMIGIVSSTNADDVMIMEYKNIGEVLSRGVEFSSKIKAFDKIELEQDLTLSRTQDMITDLIVPMRPQTTYKARLRYKANKDLELIGLFRYQSDQYFDQENIIISSGFSNMDLRANYSYSRQTSFYAGIDNIFDVTRNPAQDGTLVSSDLRPTIGRSIFLGLSFREI